MFKIGKIRLMIEIGSFFALWEALVMNNDVFGDGIIVDDSVLIHSLPVSLRILDFWERISHRVK